MWGPGTSSSCSTFSIVELVENAIRIGRWMKTYLEAVRKAVRSQGKAVTKAV